jgi:hypothetical protein
MLCRQQREKKIAGMSQSPSSLLILASKLETLYGTTPTAIISAYL